ncbi:ABC transporter permease [Thermosipho melanesiensis]|uniref:ABC transporter permease n=1 Tax=Thermosipho melanesiensis TaxID=46541 RepID=UPI001EE48B2A|nr:iron ABC transporter permease [Thermosipho melanesiensis]
MRFTIFQAFLSSFFTLLLGLPGAYIIARTKTNKFFNSIFRILSSIPFILPGVTMSIGFLMAFGKNGLITRLLNLFGFRERILYTFTAIILGHVFYNFPLYIRIVGETWEKIDSSLIEAAKMDGAKNLKIFFTIELPLLTSSIIKAFLLTYVYTFTSFSVALILGGIKYSTIEVAIYMYTKILFDFKSAFALSIFQIFFISIVSYILTFEKEVFQTGKSLKDKFPIWGYFYLFIAIIFVFIPLFYSLISGFIEYGGKLGFENFKRLITLDLRRYVGTNLSSMIIYTAFFAITSSVISVLISIASSSKNKLQYIMFLPAAISPVTLAFSYISLNINQFISIPIIHSFITLPIVYGIISSGWKAINKYSIEAALLDGANTFELVFKIKIPQVKYHILTAFFYALTLSIGEMSATITISQPPISTLSISIYRLLSSRRIPEARALNTLYSLIVILLFSLVEYLRNRKVNN